MTVDESIGKLQQLDSPDLEVWIPCPHCCGQRGSDFDLPDEEFVQAMERNGRLLAVTRDPGHECLGDGRNQSQRRVKEAVRGDIPAIAAGLGLEHVRAFKGQEDLKMLMPQDMEPRSIINRESHLVGSSFAIETKSQGATRLCTKNTGPSVNGLPGPPGQPPCYQSRTKEDSRRNRPKPIMMKNPDTTTHSTALRTEDSSGPDGACSSSSSIIGRPAFATPTLSLGPSPGSRRSLVSPQNSHTEPNEKPNETSLDTQWTDWPKGLYTKTAG